MLDITPLEECEEIVIGKVVKRTEGKKPKKPKPRPKPKALPPLKEGSQTLTVDALQFYQTICSDRDLEKILKYYK